jgi:S-adenosylmethionine uptake transporter
MQHRLEDHPLKGMGLSALGYALFSTQDAAVKWLVTDYGVSQILFIRSLIIVLIACIVGGRASMVSMARSRNKLALSARAVLILAAWLSFYTAARVMSLAQLTTLYFAAPIIVVALSAAILKERVVAMRWLAVLIGFGGVLLAARPNGDFGLVPTALVWAFLFGYLIWADIPAPNVVAGAIVIVGSSLTLIWYERRRSLRAAV